MQYFGDAIIALQYLGAKFQIFIDHTVVSDNQFIIRHLSLEFRLLN